MDHTLSLLTIPTQIIAVTRTVRIMDFLICWQFQEIEKYIIWIKLKTLKKILSKPRLFHFGVKLNVLAEHSYV